jgi:hypothetical protein
MSEEEIPVDGSQSAQTDQSATDSGAGLKEYQEDLSQKEDKDVLDSILQLPADQIMPWEIIKLPSLGKFYDGAVPDGKVEVRPMGLQEEKILSTQRLAQSGQSIDRLFSSCVKFPNPNFDPLNLIQGDRTFLLYYIRGITHGNLYEFGVECANEACKRFSMHTYDLNNLSSTIKYPDPESDEDEPFKVVLPYLSEFTNREFYVKVRYIRGYDAQTLISRNKLANQIHSEARNAGPKSRAEKAITIDQTLEENLNLVIVEAMDSVDQTKINALVSKMHARDSATIREVLQDAPGIDASVEVTCPECEKDMKMELPITENFFRPSKQ